MSKKKPTKKHDPPRKLPPGLSPWETETSRELDLAVDLALTGEIPMEMIREMLRRHESEHRAARRTPLGQGEISPEEIARFLPNPSVPPAQDFPDTPLQPVQPLLRPEAPHPKQKSKAKKKQKLKPPLRVRLRKALSELPAVIRNERATRRDWKAAGHRWDNDTEPLYPLPLLQLARELHREVYFFGLRFARPWFLFWRVVLPRLFYPLAVLGYLLRAGWMTLLHLTLRRFLRALRSTRTLHAEHKAALSATKLFPKLRLFFGDYARVLRPAVNWAMPLSALVVLAVVVHQFLGQTLALHVIYNEKDLGYIANESVFSEAQAGANQHMTAAEESVEELPEEQAAALAENQEVYAQFRLTRVRPENLVSADILTDRLLAASPNAMRSACGIYITDDSGETTLAATTKNSTEANVVLDTIKHQKTTNLDINTEKGDTVGFVQNVELVQGFFPENTLLPADSVLRKLESTKQGAATYLFQEGDTLSGIVSKFREQFPDISQDKLRKLNPRVVGRETKIQNGEVLLLSERVDYLQVKVTKTERRKETVPFESVETVNPGLYRGEKRTRIKGVNGEDSLVERVTYINGVVAGKAEIVSRTRTKDPVTERREVGSRVIKLPGGSVGRVSASGFVWPVPACHRISSPYGYRSRGFHRGLDIADGHTKGKVIVAAKDGTVEKIERGGSSYGHMVIINHGNGVKTRYAHMIAGSISVSSGQKVSAGTPIGLVGSTGRSTGPHLHFEVIVNGSTQNPLNYVRP